jgi:hypothetical protein
MRVPDTLVTFQRDEAVVEQQDVADLHVLGQILVGAADDGFIAGIDVVRGVEREGLAVLQVDLLVGETLDADLGATQVGKDADVAAGPPRGFVHQVDATAVFLVFAMGKVDARHVEADADHFGQHFDGIGGGAKGRDDLRARVHLSILHRARILPREKAAWRIITRAISRLFQVTGARWENTQVGWLRRSWSRRGSNGRMPRMHRRRACSRSARITPFPDGWRRSTSVSANTP